MSSLEIPSSQISFEIVEPTEEAARLIMGWRNDSETRDNSFHTEEKTWPEFFCEFKQDYLSDPLIPCYFALWNGQRVGFVRFRRILKSSKYHRKVVDISINIAPEKRGKGLGSAVLSATIKHARALGFHKVLAEIRLGNRASVKAFKNAGFKLEQKNVLHKREDGTKFEVDQYAYDLISNACLQNGRVIGDGNPCFVIAEAGSNWRMGSETRDIKMGKTLVDIAKESGCDAVKFQTYRAETTYVDNAGESDYLASGGLKEKITEIFKDLAMPYEMLEELSTYCEEQDMIFMSSAFSIGDLQEVDKFAPLHKIASYELTHVRLIDEAAKTGKVLILSTGASNVDDIAYAVSRVRSESVSPICLMQCTAKYPAPLSALNIEVIRWLKQHFGVPVGLSDHSRDPVIGPVSAIANGANLIEKHYTVSNDLPGPDHKFALTPRELKKMVGSIREAEKAIGDGVKHVLNEEKELFDFARRSLQAISDIKEGEEFVEDSNFAILRPGKQRAGMNPRYIEKVKTAKSSRFIKAGDGIQETDLEN